MKGLGVLLGATLFCSPLQAGADWFTCQQRVALSRYDVFVARIEDVTESNEDVSVALAVTGAIQGEVSASLSNVRWDADAELARLDAEFLIVGYTGRAGRYIADSCTREASPESLQWARDQREIGEWIRAQDARRDEFLRSGMDVLDLDALVARSDVILVGKPAAPSAGDLRIEPVRRLLYEPPKGAGCAPREIEWADAPSNDKTLIQLSRGPGPVIAFLRFNPDPVLRCHLELTDPRFGLLKATEETERLVQSALARR